MNNKTKIIVLAAFLLASKAYTQPISVNNINSSATLSTSCRFTGSDVVFGSYDPTAQDYQYSMQNIGVFCTKGTAFRISSDGNGTDRFGAFSVIRNTTNSVNILKYQIHGSDGVWSDDLYEAVRSYTGTGTGALQNLSINYRLMPNQYVSPGNYSGNHTLVLSF